MNRLPIGVCLSLILAAPALGQGIAPSVGDDLDGVVVNQPNHPVIPGSGWNWASGQPIGSVCIAGGGAEDTSTIELLNFTDVTDTSSMMHALSVDAEAKAKYIMGSANASAHFANTVEKTGFHEMVMAVATVSNNRTFVAPSDAAAPGGLSIALTPSIHTLPWHLHASQVSLDQKYVGPARRSPGLFRQNCGDGFVSMISSGGVMTILYDFTTSSEKENRDIAVKVSGSYGSFSANVAVNDTLNTYASRGNLKISYTVSGAGGTPLPTTLDQLKAQLQAFPNSVTTSPTPLTFTVTPYEQLGNWPTSSAKSRLQTINALSDMYLEFSFIEKQAAAISANRQDYDFSSGTLYTDVVNAQVLAGKYASLLKKNIASCIANSSCVLPASVPPNDYDLRAVLPVSNESSEIVSARITAATNVTNLASVLASEGPTKTIRFHGGSFPFSGSPPITVPNPKYAADSAALATAKADLASANLQYNSRLLNERLLLWVTDVGLTRCNANFEQPCLSSLKVDAYRTAAMAKIVAAGGS